MIEGHGRKVDVHGHDLFRARHGADPSLRGERIAGRRLLQPPPREVPLPPEAAIRLPEGRGDRHPRPDGQGLRVLEGPIRRLHRSPDQVHGGGGEQDDRDHRVRPRWPRWIRSTSKARITSGRTRAARRPIACSPRPCARPPFASPSGRHGKEYLTLMRPIDNGIIMQVLHYADEVRPFSEIPVGDAAVKEPELKLAVQLIEQIATDEFKPESYVDDVRVRYHEAIQRKVEGQEVTAAARPRPRRARSSTSWKRSRRAWPRRDRAPSPPPAARPRRRPSRPSAPPPRAPPRRAPCARPRPRRAASGADPFVLTPPS